MSGRRRRARARKPELSQHFLTDAAAREIVGQVVLDRAPLVVEVGAGRGALTRPLAERGITVQAIELDGYLAARLHQLVGPNVHVLEADFLKIALPSEGDYVVVGNIPYAASADIVHKITETPHPPNDVYLVVQKEFAYRCCGHPYTPQSSWSLKLRSGWLASVEAVLLPNCFTPPPAVDSALLRLLPIRGLSASVAERASFAEFVDDGFRQPNLKRFLLRHMSYRQLKRVAKDHHFGLDSTPSRLSFSQWWAAFRAAQRLRLPDQIDGM